MDAGTIGAILSGLTALLGVLGGIGGAIAVRLSRSSRAQRREIRQLREQLTLAERYMYQLIRALERHGLRPPRAPGGLWRDDDPDGDQGPDPGGASGKPAPAADPP